MQCGGLGILRYYKKHRRLLPEKVICKYFVQVCAALDHMHDRRVMHRDIKPDNVFITIDGVVKLGDLGLGRYMSSCTNVAHSVLGTPYYMAPERMSEDGYDFKSDIWSMGCVPLLPHACLPASCVPLPTSLCVWTCGLRVASIRTTVCFSSACPAVLLEGGGVCVCVCVCVRERVCGGVGGPLPCQCNYYA